MVLRKALCVSLLGSIVVAGLAVPSAADRPKPSRRVETLQYRGPSLGFACIPVNQVGCTILQPWPGEFALEVVIEDAVNDLVPGFVWQAGDKADERSTTYFCGKTNDPVRLHSWAERIQVHALARDCEDGGTPATRGRIRITYLGTPRALPQVREQHVKRGTYVAPGLSTQLIGGPVVCHGSYGWGCVAFMPRPGDKYVSVELKDASGSTVPALVYQYGVEQDQDGEMQPTQGYVANGTEICGKTERPLPIHPRADWVGVIVQAGPCFDGTPGTATTGEAIFTFSNTP